MIRIDSISDLREVVLSSIEKYDKIGLLTHENPDGDGLSTCLALKEIIEAMGKQADIVLEEPPIESLGFLEAEKRTILIKGILSYPLILLVDSQSRNRLGSCGSLLDKAELIIAIDHHLENSEIRSENKKNGIRDVDLLYNKPHTVSAGAIIFRTLQKEILQLPEDKRRYCVTAIYVSVINDTNNYTNKNTDAEVFSLAAELARMGILPYEVTAKFLYKRSVSYYRFIGQALSTIRTVADGRVLFFHSTQKMLSDNNLNIDATSKITNWVKKPVGVEVVVYFRELERDRYRLSLRSENLDVNKIAVKYGGGGHRVAAGCEICGKLEYIETVILEDIRNQFRVLRG